MSADRGRVQSVDWPPDDLDARDLSDTRIEFPTKPGGGYSILDLFLEGLLFFGYLLYNLV